MLFVFKLNRNIPLEGHAHSSDFKNLLIFKNEF